MVKYYKNGEFIEKVEYKDETKLEELLKCFDLKKEQEITNEYILSKECNF